MSGNLICFRILALSMVHMRNAFTYSIRCRRSGPSNARMKSKSALLVMICCGCQGFVYAQVQLSSDTEANPGRPTISTPATLTPVGYLQFESGFTGAQSSPEFESRFSLINVMKLAVNRRVELLTSIEPIALFKNGSTRNATADYFVGAQGVLVRGAESKPTVSISYFRRLFDGAAPEPDFGSPTNSFLLLASADLKGFHYDANAFVNEVVNKPVRRAQYGHSLTVSHSLPHRFTASLEIWRFTQPFLRGNAVGNLWAVSYEARKTLVFDVGYDEGLTSTSTQRELLFGFTYLLPHRLWRK